MSTSIPKVAHVVPALVTGGMEKLVARLLSQRAVDRTAVICLDDLGTLGRELVAQGFEVMRLGSTRGKVDRVYQLRRQLRRWQADVVHCHNLQAFTFGALAAQAQRQMTVVLTKHGTRMPVDRTLGERLRVWMARRSRIVGVSPEIQRLLATWTGQTAHRVSLIPNGMEVDDHLPARELARHQLGLPVERTLICCVARLSPEKDHDTLLLALKQVALKHPQVCLLVVGDGPQYATLLKRTHELEISSHIEFLGERHDVPQLLAASDIAVLTSQTEGMPLCILEAMAARLPVVCSRVGGIPEMVEHQRHGLLIPAGEPESFARAILNFAETRSEGSNMERPAVGTCENFSLRRTVEQYEALYAGGSAVTR